MDQRDTRLVFPLSPAQAGIWSEYEVARRLPVYNMYAAVRLRGPLDVPALRLSLQDVAARHDTLRTHIALHDGRPSQLVQPEASVELPLIDLSDRAEDLREQQLMQMIEAAARYEFDLESGPLFRCELVRMGEHEHVLLSNLHHVIADGWSNMVLVRDVARTYDARMRGQSAALPPLTIQYGQYCERLQARQRDLDACRLLDFWEERLRDLDPLLPLSAMSRRPPIKTYEALTHSCALPSALVDRLQALAQQHKCSLFMVLLAAFKVLAASYAARTDIAVATPTANRGEPELADLIGLFANTLVLRTDLARAATFADVLRRVKQSCAAAFRHQQVPFHDVVDAVKPARDPSQLPFTQIFFVLHNVPSDAPPMGELRLESIALPRRLSAYDLQVELFREGAGMRVDFTFNRDLYEQAFVSQLTDHYASVLRQVANDHEVQMSAIVLHDPADEVEGADAAAAASVTTTRALLDTACRLSASAPAVVTATEAVTYDQLRQRATDLAGALSQTAPKPGVLTIVTDDLLELAIAVGAGLQRGDVCRLVAPAEAAQCSASDLLMTRDENVLRELDPHRAASNLGSGWWLLRRYASAQSLPSGAAFVFGGHASAVVSDAMLIAEVEALARATRLPEQATILQLGDAGIASMMRNLALAWRVGGALHVGRSAEELPPSADIICMAISSTADVWPRDDYAPSVDLLCTDGALSALASSKVAAASRRILYSPGVPELFGAGPHHVRAMEQGGELRLALHIGKDSSILNALRQPAPSGTRGRLFRLSRDVPMDTGLLGIRHGVMLLIEHDDAPAWVWRKGRRVYLADIEREMRSLDRVEDCVVRVRRRSDGETLLVAYVVHAPFVSIDHIIERAAQRLSDRMPEAMVSIGAIPRRTDGGVDETALSARPIVDSAVLKHCEDEARGISGVHDAAAVLDRPQATPRLLHWTDLCPAGVRLSASSSEGVAPSTARHEALAGSPQLAHSIGPALTVPPSAPVVLSELLVAASQDRTKGIIYLDEQARERRETYQDVLEQAARIRGGLVACGMQPGDILIYQFADNRDFLHAFWACLLGGFVPVPLEVASDYAQASVKRDKLFNVWQALNRPRVITDRARAAEIRSVQTPAGAVDALAIESLREHAPDFEPHPAQPDDLALLLLTSGSTGAPKAVMQTHRALLARCRATAAAFELDERDVSFNWMPMDHVGGIVMFHLLDVFLRATQVHAATAAVLEEPLRWIEWLSRYRATVTWAPNFAYALLNDRLAKGRPTNIDLSAVRCMLNAGEVVVAPTCRRFLSLLAPVGLAANAIRPSWGMSETCSVVTGNHRFTVASTSDSDPFVSNGRPFATCEMRIVDAQDQLMAEASVGRIQVRGPMVTGGYYQNAAATAASFTQDGWFKTGDLGYLLDGELYITGREKDTIIVNGTNYYPHEIEAVVERVAGVQVASVAACALRRAGSQTDDLVVFFSQLSGEGAPPLSKLVHAIRAAVIEQVGLPPMHVIPLAFEQIPKTSIGKIQRSALVRQLEAGEFESTLKRLDLELETPNTLRECFFARQWRASELSGEEARVHGLLMFDDATGVAAELSSRVSQRFGAPVVLVRAAEEYRRYDELRYDIDPRCDDHYVRLLQAVRADEIEIDEIVHLWTLTDEQVVGDIAQLRDAQQIGALSVLRMVRSLRDVHGEQRTMRLRVVSRCSQDVGGDGQFRAAHGALFGLLQTVRLEMPWLRAGHIDLDEPAFLDGLAAELGRLQVDAEVAYRRGVRLQPGLRRVDITRSRSDAAAVVRGGTYVVIGGLGGIGVHVVEMLLTQFDATVLIVGRSDLSSQSADARAATYERLMAKSAGRLTYACADIREPDVLEREVAAAERRWGRRLAGIFNLANEGSIEQQWSGADRNRIATQTAESFEEQFSTKVYGAWSVAQLLRRRPRATLVSFSSVNGLFGGNLLGAYSASCSFQHRLSWALRTGDGRDCYCMLWTVWQNTGMTRAMPEFAAHASRALGYRALSIRQGLWSLLGTLRKAPGEWVIGLDPTSPALRQRLFLKEPPESIALYVASNEANAILQQVKTVPDRLGACVNARIIRVPSIPRREDGSLDREALRAGENGAGRGIGAEPRNDRERQLLQIWRSVLGSDSLSVQDNFFDLGGDSILAIQVVARANRLGWRLSTRSMFEHQTIASFADAAQELQHAPAARSAYVGEVPLAPVQQWFLEQRFRKPNHWNQSVMLEVSGALNEGAMQSALDALVAHHEMLRLKVMFREQPRAFIDDTVVRVPFERVRITDGPAAASASLQREATRVQGSLDLEQGRAVCAAWFDFGAHQPGYLLLAVHHMVVDGVSWRILIVDFLTAYEQALQGQPIELPPRTASYAEWSSALREAARSAQFRTQAQYWIDMPRDGYVDLGSSLSDPGEVGREAVASFALSRDTTLSVLKHPARVNDLLLTALVLALRECRGPSPVLLTMEGHGRGGVGDELDLSLTVGWFTTIYPLALVIPPQADAGQALVAVKRQLERVPEQGLSFGVMRYLSEDESVRNALAALPKPRISFNYLGQFDGALSGQERFRFADVPAGRMQDAVEKRVHELEIVTYVVDGVMRFNWSYDATALLERTVNALLRAFELALTELLTQTDRNTLLTPADFPLVDLDESQLRGALECASEQGTVIEQIWPATSTQQGLLFHSLRDPDSGVYLSQLINEIRGELDAQSLREAWQAAVDRNEVYRTCFHALDSSAPLQLVLERVAVDWTLLDWSDLDADQQTTRWQAMLREDRSRGFDPTRAPLMRVTVVRFAIDVFRLILTEHHAITDGWSRALILRDVFEYYGAAVQRRQASLPARPSYAGYVSWLRKQSLAEAQRYWSELLAGFDAPTSIAAERSSSAEPDTTTEHFIDRKIDGAVTLSLRRAARKHGVTLSTELQGAWAILLGRYADRREVVFGATHSGRSPSVSGVHEMTGLFITNLPVRVSVEGAQQTGEWLRGLQAQQLASAERAYVSLREIQSWSEIAPPQPLFESVVVIENYPAADAAEAHGVRLAWADSVDQSHFPLMLVIETKNDALTLRMYFDRARFGSGAVTRMLEQYEMVLDALGAEATQLHDVQLLTRWERELLASLNRTHQPFDSHRCMQECLTERAHATPDAIAVISADRNLTYGELFTEAVALSDRLCSAGAIRNELVAVLMEKGWQQVVAVYGALYSGAAYLPIDPAWPHERQQRVVEASGAKLVVSTARGEELPQWARTLPIITVEPGAEQTWPASDPPLRQSPDDVAYVIFTSGSTGTPKGVTIRHSAAMNTLLDINERFNVTSADRVLGLSSLTFDLSVYDIFGIIAAGGALVMPSPAAAKDPQAWIELIERHRVTIWDSVPAMMQIFVDQLDEQRANIPWPRVIMLSGDWIPLRLPQRIRAYAPDSRIVSLGGATEASIWSISYEIDAIDPTWTSIPYGRPLANQSFHVLNEQLQPCPIDVPGDLYIGGVGLAEGYWHDAERTARQFIVHPRSGERLYRTGDRGRVRRSGYIEFLGRIDAQVKVHGYRVDLTEIENALAGLPGIKAAVVAVKEGRGGRHLVGYVVPMQSGALDPTLLRAELVAKLPEYMIPWQYIAIDSVPLTSNGKVDRKRLPDITSEDRGTTPSHSSMTQELLAAIWADVLNAGDLQPDDNFFERGGHSLLVTQVMARVRKTFSIELPLRTLFDLPTLRQLTVKVDEARASSMIAREPLRRVAAAAVEASSAQKRSWFIEQLQEVTTTLNVATRLLLQGALDTEALERSLRELMSRHESLRTLFEERDGVVMQVIAERLALPLRVIESRDMQALEDSTREARRAFDLARGPLWRISVYRLAPQRHLLLVAFHHSICDGWSLAVFMRELVQLYEAGVAGSAPSLPPPAVQYKDFSEWQRTWLQSEECENQLAYWRQALAGAPATATFPANRPRPAQLTGLGADVEFDVEPSLVTGIAQLSKREAVTPYVVYLATLAMLLTDQAEQSDITIGATIANRRYAELEGVIGFFANQAAIRVQVEQQQTFLQFLSMARGQVLAAYDNQDVPFERVVDAVGRAGALSHTPLFQVKLVLQNTPVPIGNIAGLQAQPVDLDLGAAKFDLQITMEERAPGLHAIATYSVDLYEEAYIRSLVADYLLLMSAAITDPTLTVGELLERMREARKQRLRAVASAVLGKVPMGGARVVRANHRDEAQ